MQSQEWLEGVRKNRRQSAFDVLEPTLNTQYVSFVGEHYWS